MIRQIHTILVPVDFSENTEVAISKALELCPEGNANSTIHLLHVQRIISHGFSYFLSNAIVGYTQKQVNSDIKISTRRLEDVKNEIKVSRPDINVQCWVSFGDTVQESIIKKARQLWVDLIIIGKSSHHSLLTFLNTVVPSKLAQVSGIPVLTAKPGSLNQEIKTVVIPVGNHFPESKLEMFGALRNRWHPNIRLVTFREEESNDSKQLLLYTFRAFKSKFANSINYEILEGGNKARALLKYCNKVGADVLIVYPGAETRTGTWPKSNISDMLPRESKTQILAITPS